MRDVLAVEVVPKYRTARSRTLQERTPPRPPVEPVRVFTAGPT
ncbi:DUF2379 domain-containing protein [Cystobacter fuscus]|nr:DUF2379 domain-containing protein [Cystobacter fuscus]